MLFLTNHSEVLFMYVWLKLARVLRKLCIPTGKPRKDKTANFVTKMWAAYDHERKIYPLA